MGNLSSLLQLTITCLILLGCSTEEIDDTDLTNKIKQETNKNSNQISPPVVSPNELIIEYPKDEDISDAAKAMIRQEHGVIAYETCNCSNQQIEKWKFGTGINIEEEEVLIQDRGIDVEHEFYYQNSYPSVDLNITNIEQNLSLISANMVSSASKITIAVLDTGIDLNLLPNTGPFLYRLRPQEQRCKENGILELSGWDFVNKDNNPHDDNGHGTIVTGIIKDNLNINHRGDFEILPVKVFDHNGEGSYFNLLCGYTYAADKSAVSIINMSFGWYHRPGRLLNKHIAENNHILHITSAGNDTSNNDSLNHFPSSYRHLYSLAIGSINTSTSEISDFSNFGKTSVDFLSLGDSIPFFDNSNKEYTVSGTSYAVPFVTAKSAKHYIEGNNSPFTMINQLFINATPIPAGSELLPVKCNNKIID